MSISPRQEEQTKQNNGGILRTCYLLLLARESTTGPRKCMRSSARLHKFMVSCSLPLHTSLALLNSEQLLHFSSVTQLKPVTPLLFRYSTQNSYYTSLPLLNSKQLLHSSSVTLDVLDPIVNSKQLLHFSSVTELITITTLLFRD